MARIDYLSSDAVFEDHGHLFEGYDDPAAAVLNVHRALAAHSDLFDAWGEWTLTLYAEGIDARRRELVVLAVARTAGLRYVWHQHVGRALEDGVARTEILAISAGDLAEFVEAERAVIAYAVAFADRVVDDEIHASVSQHVAAADLVAIALLAGEYLRLGYVFDAFGVDPETEFVGWNLERLD